MVVEDILCLAAKLGVPVHRPEGERIGYKRSHADYLLEQCETYFGLKREGSIHDRVERLNDLTQELPHARN